MKLTDMFNLFLAGANPNEVLKERTEGCTGRTALHSAVSCGSLPAVMLLIAKGADVNKVRLFPELARQSLGNGIGAVGRHIR